MFLFEVYLMANQLFLELDLHLMNMRIVDADHPTVLARDDLQLFIADYEVQQARWIDGFNACQSALDVLYPRGKAAA